MQDFIDQAAKNGITLLYKGRCQFCGAECQKGILECLDTFSNVLVRLDFKNSNQHLSKFLSVDAHALQHPEIHGRWSNHFHLSRLNLILNKQQLWDYKKSPQLSKYLNEYKINRQNEFLVPPKPLERGAITSKNFTKVNTAVECVDLINKWAHQVYSLWALNHSLVSKIAEGFLAWNNFKK